MQTEMSRIWTSGTFAREIGRSVETVRRLEQRGILSPRRDVTGRRLYSEDDLAKCREYLAQTAR
jgi:DNA-binding transcriptional MerR regulator